MPENLEKFERDPKERLANELHDLFQIEINYTTSRSAVRDAIGTKRIAFIANENFEIILDPGFHEAIIGANGLENQNLVHGAIEKTEEIVFFDSSQYITIRNTFLESPLLKKYTTLSSDDAVEIIRKVISDKLRDFINTPQ